MTDLDGTVLEIGDIVNVPCRVVGFGKDEEAANTKLETLHKLLPNGFTTTLHLNARQLVHVGVSDEEPPAYKDDTAGGSDDGLATVG